MKENYYERLLNINTTGNENWNRATAHNHPYEPTLYEALDTLCENYILEENDHIVDFGSGKGRIIFYINHFFRCYANGVEMNEIYYNESLLNKSKYIQKNKKMEDKINFYCNLSQNYDIGPKDNKFYFFNPFSVQIFMKVVENIMQSFEDYPRNMDLIIYYPSDDYIQFLEYRTPFMLEKEIVLDELYKNDDKEKFVVYSLKTNY
ncbi:SAM-dependent methyltransferase [Intestinibacter sp.]